MAMIPVILSGGSGERLWPISRKEYPKQFVHFFSSSLFSNTYKRLGNLGAPMTVTTKNLEKLTLETYAQSGGLAQDILFEPMRKNTAAAIALLCKVLQDRGLENEIAGIFPSDHLIQKEDLFCQAIKHACQSAKTCSIVTLGIAPSHPSTAYGYIHIQKNEEGLDKAFFDYPVQGFKEKPSLEKAKEYISQGDYQWNAGIFVFQVSKMIDLLNEHLPEIWQPLTALNKDLSNLESIYSQLPSISIDYGVMEKTKDIKCIPVDIGWSDLGSWDEMSKHLPNHAQSIQVESEKNFVYSKLDKKYALVDVEDLIIVDTDDALLITKKGSSEKTKNVIDVLSKKFQSQTT